ncbi:unnamed protein product [Agarophyton chilense]|eukprot:gb/GEZJ01002540.1/.p1 GENE.gb/GEZJ01002540.1/~~gb/GEZJ01002540.1/.p1  ORF type:complete len:783 (-),score=110.78 gb/GEZJ01002540.1/:633-2981(-)
MELLLDPGLALSAVEYAVNILASVKHMAEDQRQNAAQYEQLQSRLRAMRDALQYVTRAACLELSSPVWRVAFARIKSHFERVMHQLRTVRDAMRGHTLARCLHAAEVSRILHQLDSDVDVLQRDLDHLGFFTMSDLAARRHARAAAHNVRDVQHSLAAMHQQLTAMAADVSRISQSAQPSSLPDTLLTERRPPQQLMHCVEQTQQQLRAQLPELQRRQRADPRAAAALHRVEALTSRWRLDAAQISLSHPHTPGHDWQQNTYTGTLTLRDAQANVVRVAQVLVKLEPVPAKALALLRELVVLRQLCHPCLTAFYGASWPDGTFSRLDAAPSRVAPARRAMIVTERMTHALPSVIRQRVMGAEAVRVRVLRDVASAVAYLHSRGLFHIDLNPANVLLRIVSGQIVGTAKFNCLALANSITQLPQHAQLQQRHLVCVNSIAQCDKPGRSQMPQPPSQSTLQSTSASASNARHTGGAAMSSAGTFRFGVLVCFVLSSTHTPFGRSNHLEQMLSPASDSSRSMPLSFWTKGIQNKKLRSLAELCLSHDESCRPCFQFIHHTLQKFINNEQLPQLHKGASSNALYMNGKNSFHGRNGWVKDAKLAKILFEDASSKGHIPSTLQLGDCYFRGLGAQRDAEKGVQMYTKAADAGYSRAQHRLGDCYYKGDGVKRNVPLAIEMYRRAASQGHSSAQQKLSRHFGLSQLGSELSSAKSEASGEQLASFSDIGSLLQESESSQHVGVHERLGSKPTVTSLPEMAGTVFKSIAGGSSIAMNALGDLEQFYANL